MTKNNVRVILLISCFCLLNLFFYTLAVAETDEPLEPSSPPAWENVLTISSDSGARLPSVAAAPNSKEVIVAYISQRSANEENTDPYYHDSSNNGATFPGNPAPINTNASTEAIDVAVTFDSSNVAHALWIEETSSDNRELRYAKESSWPTSSSLRASVTNPGVIFTPRIVASGSNTLDIVWAQSSSGIITDIYHARSTNGGSSWSTSKVILDTADLSQSPDLAVANGVIHVVWSEGLINAKINYVQSTNGGSSWSAPIQISNRSSATNALEPSIIANGSVVQAAYTNRVSADNQAVHYLRCNGSCTNINNWISSNNPVSGTKVGANVGDPYDVASTIAQAGVCTHLYFHGVQTGSNEQIIGLDSCGKWSSSARDVITSSTVRALNPDLATQNNWWVYLVYEDKTNAQIKFLRNLPAIYLPMIRK